MIVKICGITRHDDLLACADYGVDWVGINLWPTSPRYVTRPVAEALAVRARELGLGVVGLLVEPDPAEVMDLWRTGLFDHLQLYGVVTVPPEVRWIRPVPVATAADLATTGEETTATVDLVEARVAGHGGRGRRFEWRWLEGHRWHRPTLVAGGITPDNVAELLSHTQPYGIDVASGVEREPGRKDPDLIHALVRTVRRIEADRDLTGT